MNTNAVRETFRVLPADSVAYRCNPPLFGRKSKNPPMAVHQRWGEAMNDRQWGWRVALTHHASAEPLPPSLRDSSIRRAYRYLQGARDEQMAGQFLMSMKDYPPSQTPGSFNLEGIQKKIQATMGGR